MEQLDESSLGRERGEFATPGSPLAQELAQCAKPETAGWYVDPLSATRARKFNGSNWTGLTRDLIAPDTATPVARTVAAPDPAAPLLIGNCEFEQADGIAVPASFVPELNVKVTLDDAALNLTGPGWGGPQPPALRIARSDIVGVEIWSGERPSSKHSVLNYYALYGVIGAAISFSKQGKYKRERVGKVAVQVVTPEGFIIVTDDRNRFLTINDRLRPLAEEAAVNLAKLPTTPELDAALAGVPTGGADAIAADSAELVVAMIEQLAQLHSKGILTDAEFADKKAELLGRI